MDRTSNTLVNFAFFFAVGYGIAAGLRDRKAGVRIGALVGAVGAALSWIGYEKPSFLDDDDPDPIEIDV